MLAKGDLYIELKKGYDEVMATKKQILGDYSVQENVVWKRLKTAYKNDLVVINT